MADNSEETNMPIIEDVENTNEEEKKVPEPATPEYAARECPPPSYSEIMGQEVMTSAIQTKEYGIPPLSYLDILPRCVQKGNPAKKLAPIYHSFSMQIQAANQWLKANPGFCVWKCETVERVVDNTGVIRREELLVKESALTKNHICQVLRVWLTKMNTPDGRPQQIGCENFIPDRSEVNIPDAPMRRGTSVIVPPGYFLVGDDFIRKRYGKKATFADPLPVFLDKVNQKLKTKPIRGTILCVEMLENKTCDEFDTTTFDPDVTCWSDNPNDFRRISKFLRVFFMSGPPANETINVEQFVPNVTKQPSHISGPQFEELPVTLGRISAWIPANYGIRVVNVQGNMVRYNTFISADFQLGQDCMDDWYINKQKKTDVRVTNVFYVTNAEGTGPELPISVSCRVFTPARIGGNRFETMSQLMFRVDCWLRATCLPIFSVETSLLPVDKSDPNGVATSKQYFLTEQMSGTHSCQCITAYFPQEFVEPAIELLPVAQVVKGGANQAGEKKGGAQKGGGSNGGSQQSSSSCTIL